MAAPTPHKALAWWQFPVTRTMDTGDPGIDFQTPFHTPVNALLPGTVTNITHGGWGLEVDVAGPRGTTESYVHLDQLASNIRIGQQIAIGQLLGLSGGQLSGGSNPATSTYSSGPHTEFDIFQGTPWQAPKVDPRPFFARLSALVASPLGALQTTAGAVGAGTASVAGSLSGGIAGAIGGAFGTAPAPPTTASAAKASTPSGGSSSSADFIQILKDLIRYTTPTGAATDALGNAEQQAAQAAGVSMASIAKRSGFVIVGVLLLLVVVVALLWSPATRTAAVVAPTTRMVSRVARGAK